MVVGTGPASAQTPRLTRGPPVSPTQEAAHVVPGPARHLGREGPPGGGKATGTPPVPLFTHSRTRGGAHCQVLVQRWAQPASLRPSRSSLAGEEGETLDQPQKHRACGRREKLGPADVPTGTPAGARGPGEAPPCTDPWPETHGAWGRARRGAQWCWGLQASRELGRTGQAIVWGHQGGRGLSRDCHGQQGPAQLTVRSGVPSQPAWAVGRQPGKAVPARGRVQGWEPARAGLLPPATLGDIPQGLRLFTRLWEHRLPGNSLQGQSCPQSRRWQERPLPRSQQEAKGTQALNSCSRTFHSSWSLGQAVGGLRAPGLLANKEPLEYPRL